MRGTLLALPLVTFSGCGLTLDLEPGDAGAATPDARISTDARTGAADGAPADGRHASDATPLDAVVSVDGATPTCGLCGDLDGDGAVGDQDMIALRSSLRGTDTPSCPSYADVDADGDWDVSDVVILDALIAGRVRGEACAPCDLMCGDANSDGTVDIADATTIREMISPTGSATACEWAAANALVDTSVDVRDADLIVAYALSGGPAPCTP